MILLARSRLNLPGVALLNLGRRIEIRLLLEKDLPSLARPATPFRPGATGLRGPPDVADCTPLSEAV